MLPHSRAVLPLHLLNISLLYAMTLKTTQPTMHSLATYPLFAVYCLAAKPYPPTPVYVCDHKCTQHLHHHQS